LLWWAFRNKIMFRNNGVLWRFLKAICSFYAKT
jgi:hypothetical protein